MVLPDPQVAKLRKLTYSNRLGKCPQRWERDRSETEPRCGITAASSQCPIRWLLVRDPTGELEPQAFLATDPSAHPRDIITWFVRRWQVEVTFEEVRAHLGVETQRQWSDKAILRTTPLLLGLYSVITLCTHDLAKSRKFKPRTAAWYPKAILTFSDAIAAVRREIWAHQISSMSRPHRDTIEISRHIWNRMQTALAYAA